MIDRRTLFRTAWRAARLEAGTRYGVTLTLRQAFVIALRHAWAAAKAAAARMQAMCAGIAKAAQDVLAEVKAGKGAGLKPKWSPRRNYWQFANANAYGGL